MPNEKLRSSLPWWVMEAISYLQDECLPAWGEPTNLRAFEWGAGGSTLWLSQRCGQVVSVEHDREWYAQVGDDLDQYGIENVRLVFRRLDSGYVEAITSYPDEAFDLISVDGRRRADCIRAAFHKLAKDGIFVVDDSQREQYQDAMELLRNWERHDFREGEKQTTVWRRR